MRTTLTLEADVAALIERDMKDRGVGLKAAVNDAIRRGLGSTSRDDVVFPTADLGRSTHDLDHATALAAALEDEELVRRLAVGK